MTRFPTQDAGFVRLAAPPARPLWWTLLAALSFAAAGCSNPSSTPTTGKSPPPERPVVQTRSARTPPAAPKQEAPPTRPADTLPPSRYESRPPYPVDLHVRTPDDPQPGWLRILELAETNRPAELHGKFPEQNLMVVDSQNVRRLDIHIGHLPLAQGKRIFLRIDGQGIELRRGKGDFITFERSPAGVWNRVADH